MFHNCGKKIKLAAKILVWLGIAVSLIYAIALWSEAGRYSGDWYGGDIGSGDLVGVGFKVLFAGSLGSWLGSLVLYAFGQLVENSDTIVRSLTGSAPQPANGKNKEVSLWVGEDGNSWTCSHCGTKQHFARNECVSCGSRFKSKGHPVEENPDAQVE